MSPNTEREYRKALQEEGLLAGDPQSLPSMEELNRAVDKHKPPQGPAQQVSSVELWSEEIRKGFDDGASPKAIWDKLRLEKGDEFTGSVRAVQRYFQRIEREIGSRPEDVAIPVHTAPGHVGQVDFGYLGKVYDPEVDKERKAYIFVLVLGFSRHMYAEIVLNQKTDTWLQLHINAFEKLKGVIGTIVPDNLKAAVIRAAFGSDGRTELNRSFQEMARYYGFEVVPTPVRAPKKKGKVESGVKYVKRNFHAPRRDWDLHQLRRELPQWIEKTAGGRDHGTTHQAPLELFQTQELQHLLPLPDQPYEMVVWKEATVYSNNHIIYEYAYY